jgi:formate hydrogenlyase subunit 3/multisubunit Na+/H+ antiporter MnhD subunit
MNELIARLIILLNELFAQPMVLLIAVPFITGVVCWCIPKKMGTVAAIIAGITSVYTLFLVWPLFRSGSCIYTYNNWLFLRLDGMSAFILLATVIFGLLILIYSFGYMKGKDRQNQYYAYVLWTIGASCGALLASEFILLLIFWGFLGITLYLLIGIAGPDASVAAKKTFIIIGGSDSILILGIALLWLMRHTTHMEGTPVEFSGPLSYIAFFCLAIAAFAKAGAMPFHSWVPDCGEKAPASVAAFLPASLDKLLGIYLLFRTVTLFKMSVAANTTLAFIGAATIILAVMMALVQHDLKRLLSYHAVSQVGYMVLGISTGTALGLAGGLFHMLNNAMYKSCLFLGAGAIEKRTGTSDLDKLGGLARTMPVTLFVCIVASMSISGIPPLNGFASKWMIYQGIIESGRSGGFLWVVWLTAAMLGSALTLASFMKLLHAAFFRAPSPEVVSAHVGADDFSGGDVYRVRGTLYVSAYAIYFSGT